MRKIALWLVVVLVAGAAMMCGLAEMRVREYEAREWPIGLGRIADVPHRYPMTGRNAAATKLISLANDLEINFRSGAREQPLPAIRKETTDYLQSQLKRSSGPIDPLPPALAAHLAKHAEALAKLRAHLIAEPVRWEVDTTNGVDGPLPNLVATMSLGRLLTVNALDRARRGDAAAWDDLQASWMLSRALAPRPELISQLISMALARSVNSASRLMPLPEPPWMREVRGADSRRAMLASLQAEAWAMRGGTAARKRVLRYMTADTIEQMRTSANQLAEISECAFDADAFARKQQNEIPAWNKVSQLSMPNLAGAWQRVFRFNAELEATERINQIRGGAAPS
ncbi:MAG TPA: hypothetical protein VN181_07400, partial [Thermoanaerobaculia bacterium]|nr:hypothetical protein [Thermoanaerobaculia bacterium]